MIGKAGYGERWRELNPEKVEAYNEAYNDARRQEGPSLVPCRYCGTRFERPSTARRVFCSKRCERAADNARRRKVA